MPSLGFHLDGEGLGEPAEIWVLPDGGDREPAGCWVPGAAPFNVKIQQDGGGLVMLVPLHASHREASKETDAVSLVGGLGEQTKPPGAAPRLVGWQTS